MIHDVKATCHRILVIDDNHEIHNDFRKILAGRDDTAFLDEAEAVLFGEAEHAVPSPTMFDISDAHQGQEGLQCVEQALAEGAPFAMAFVDVRMPPGWDGIETIERIWRVDSAIQIVICTAYSDYSWDDIVQRFGENDSLLILKKPFDHAEVRQMAAAMATKWDLERDARCRLEELEQAVQDRTRELESQRDYLEDALARLQEMHSQLLQAQKLESIGQLAAGIAHEINTPTQYVADNLRFLEENIPGLLTLIDCYQGMLDPSRASRTWIGRQAEIQAIKEKLDFEFLLEEIPRALEQSLEGVDRVAEIVRSIKEFSHPGGDEKQWANLNQAIASTITVARNEWKYVAEMVTDFDKTLPPVPCVLGDLNQVILNIIVNAAHAIGDVSSSNNGQKGLITVSTRHDGNWAEIRVSDTGGGIPEDIRTKIFDPFFTTKEVGKGTGQGLAIAHTTVVNKHGGSLRVESETGCGSTFIIRLPIEQESSREEITEHEEAHSLR